jgi:hypothetical protein
MSGIDRWPHRYLVPGLLAINVSLAFTSMLGDSITLDEVSHLTSGYSYLRTGDFRMAPDHPPLAKLWAALPLLLVDNHWPGPQVPGWQAGDYWAYGKHWLFVANDGERLAPVARGMMVVLLPATCLCIYAIGRGLFGPPAGLLALSLAAFCPTLLAHGRLVTTDLPATLCSLLTLLAAARLLRRITPFNVLLAGLALAAFALTKFSWPLVLPALVAMAIAAVVLSNSTRSSVARAGGAAADPVQVPRTAARRALALAGAAALIGLVTWLAIWTCFGWRYSPFIGPDRDRALMVTTETPDEPTPGTMALAWDAVLRDYDGRPMRGVMAALLRFARDRRLLPEAYLYGVAYTHKTTLLRAAYLCGEFSDTGFRSYFPIAFAIKTPVPTMLLIVAGIAAIALRRARPARNGVLLVGLATYVACYAATAVASNINIGHRHLLPLYPPLLVAAGAAAAWLGTRAGRWLIGAALLWLVGANLYIHPHYLSYFNELIGGPARGHLYLADSNVDWGQDLKRLAAYARRHPGEKLKLAYFGAAIPTRYGFPVEMLPSFHGLPVTATLDGGTYVVSATQLHGVYDLTCRDEFWQNANAVAYYRNLHTLMNSPQESLSEKERRDLPRMRELFDQLRWGRLVCALRRRAPDERIGWSLLVYRLSAAQLDRMTRP